MSEIEALKEFGTPRKYNEDDLIFKEGEIGHEMFVVLAGKVGVFLNSFDGFPLLVKEMNPGDFFGEMALLDDRPRSATAIAITPTVVMVIGRNNFQSFICRQPSMAFKIMKGLSARIRILDEELAKLKESTCKEHRAQSLPQTPHAKTIQSSTSTTKESASFTELLYPDGHKSYGTIEPEVYSTYVFDKPITCPVCGKGFTVKMPRVSKLKLDHIDVDFRKIHIDFELLWYSIWVCPACYYSNFYFEFDSIPDKAIKLIREKTEALKGKIKPDFTTPRNIDQVFTAYYLTLMCAETYKAPPLKIAKLWMQISWLYKDINDNEMFTIASENALDKYYDAFYNTKLNINTEQEQQCCLILGELFLLKGETKEAQKHYYAAIKRGSGSDMLNQQAADRIDFLKNHHKS